MAQRTVLRDYFCGGAPQVSAAVAGFGMLLRGSEQRGDATWASVRDLARAAADGDTRRIQLVSLVETAARLAGSPLGGATVAR